MKKGFLVLICISFLMFSQAQKYAITESGEEVILNDDGTWQYKNKEDSLSKVISLNPKTFNKNSKATFLLKSQKVNLGFWLDPKKWSFKKAITNEEAEYELEFKGGDLYGMIISEKVEIPLETLKELAITNAKSVSPDARIVKEEYRLVNGKKVLLLQMNGTMKGIKFSYYGYYYSNSKGTIQFITYTSQALMNTHLGVCEELLNGLIEIE